MSNKNFVYTQAANRRLHIQIDSDMFKKIPEAKDLLEDNDFLLAASVIDRFMRVNDLQRVIFYGRGTDYPVPNVDIKETADIDEKLNK